MLTEEGSSLFKFERSVDFISALAFPYALMIRSIDHSDVFFMGVEADVLAAVLLVC